MTDPHDSDFDDRPDVAEALPRLRAPIVPGNSIAGRALIAVVAIMTFLASMTTGTVVLLRSAANDWQAEVAREVTIQVRPISGRDLEADVNKAAETARAAPNVAEVRPYSKEESSRLLEPWLGSGAALDDLPVPRMIVVKLSSQAKPDLADLRKALREQLPNASIDDHRGWIDQMRSMSRTAVAGGILILLLVFAATALSVTFATRGAIATNRPVVEVLHFIGASDRFIAGHFQRHFLWLGLKGGAIGGGAAILLFAMAEMLGGRFLGGAGADRVSALFGTFSIGTAGYFAVGIQVIVIAFLIAATSRETVNRTLRSIE
jgi:cell division transport system permease protein